MANQRRLELHEKFCELLGTRNVYFQPPSSVKMVYPAIVYSLGGVKPKRADNQMYLIRKRYSVTVIDKDPDADWESIMLNTFEYCEFERPYAADNLNHWQFTLYW